jgi:hypothetical protein
VTDCISNNSTSYNSSALNVSKRYNALLDILLVLGENSVQSMRPVCCGDADYSGCASNLRSQLLELR